MDAIFDFGLLVTSGRPLERRRRRRRRRGRRLAFDFPNNPSRNKATKWNRCCEVEGLL